MLIKMSQINEVLCPIPSPRHELLGDETGAEMAIIECMVGTTFIGTIHYLPHINPLILRKTKPSEGIVSKVLFLTRGNTPIIETMILTHPMLRPLSFKAQVHKDFWKPCKPCHVGIHWIVLVEYSQMSTHLPGFQSFFSFFASFCIGQVSHQQLRVKQSRLKHTKINGTIFIALIIIF